MQSNIPFNQCIHATLYKAIEIISYDGDFPFTGEISIYIPSPRYLYLLKKYNSFRVLENDDEIHSSSM